MWFEDLTGFTEENRQTVQKNITVTGDTMTSLVNGRSMTCGILKTPSLAELRQEVAAYERPRGKIVVKEIVADVQQLHGMLSNQHALFQVASQFNLLEMVSPTMTPEHGVAIYQHDYTQGPACAIAAGAGTIYRNYFVPVHGSIGQSNTQQLDLLADLGDALGNQQQRLWKMQNGYTLATSAGLRELTRTLDSLNEGERDALRERLRIGLQWNTEFTLNKEQQENPHLITQAYCSALPVSYSEHDASLWQAFATLILEASYEATLCAGIINAVRKGNNNVYLTLLGGGAFGNKTAWIIAAIERALALYQAENLEISIVSHSGSNPSIQHLID